MYYQWTNQNDFETWHNALCKSLNYPEIVNGKVITDSYTMGFEYKAFGLPMLKNNIMKD